MSYILEALKKAQAERQIGSAPTIHAPTLASAPAGQGVRSNRTPVIVAMALMAAAIAGLATMLLRQPPAASPPPAASASPAAHEPTAAAPVIAGAVPSPAPTAASAPVTVNAPSAPAAPAVGTAPEAQVAAPIVAATKPATRVADARAVQAAVSERAPVRAAQQAAAPAVAQPPAPPAAPAPVEEQVQSLRELPEPIQRAIPQITLGGYMYSKNPADRLLLIDKVLRKEGEEVAPGLILDKLQPKQAIFSFRGYRYRVPL